MSLAVELRPKSRAGRKGQVTYARSLCGLEIGDRHGGSSVQGHGLDRLNPVFRALWLQ